MTPIAIEYCTAAIPLPAEGLAENTMTRFFAVLPAAGASQRMGSPKLLLPWGRGCLLEHVLSVWTFSKLDRVAIVLPPDVPELARIAGQFDVEVVVPSSRPPDMKASVRLGLARLTANQQPAPNDAWLLAPADLPGITPAVIAALIDRYDPATGSAVVPVHGDRRGHPVLLPWSTVRQLDDLPEDRGINDVLHRLPKIELPIDHPGLLDDIDTPDDYARLRNMPGCTIATQRLTQSGPKL